MRHNGQMEKDRGSSSPARFTEGTFLHGPAADNHSRHRHLRFGDSLVLSMPIMNVLDAARALRTGGGGPPERAKMIEIFRRHGMTVAAPPPLD